MILIKHPDVKIIINSFRICRLILTSINYNNKMVPLMCPTCKSFSIIYDMYKL